MLIAVPEHWNPARRHVFMIRPIWSQNINQKPRCGRYSKSVQTRYRRLWVYRLVRLNHLRELQQWIVGNNSSFKQMWLCSINRFPSPLLLSRPPMVMPSLISGPVQCSLYLVVKFDVAVAISAGTTSQASLHWRLLLSDIYMHSESGVNQRSNDCQIIWSWLSLFVVQMVCPSQCY